MAKSVRSKSQRKNRAIKRETTFKPVADDRARRLALRDKISQSQACMVLESPAESSQHGFSQPSKKPTTRGKKLEKSFNSYGLSPKELCF